MKRVSKAHIRSILRTKTGPTRYGKLVRALGTTRGLSEVLESMERSGEIVRDSKRRMELRYLQKEEQDNRFNITGVVRKDSRHWFLEPLVWSEFSAIRISPTQSIKHGDIATVRIRPGKDSEPQGKVVEVIEADSVASQAALAMLKACEVPHGEDWGSDVDSVKTVIDEEVLRGRKDLRTTPFVTIDGENARDFDDAVYTEKHEDGSWRLCVAIADVAHYVRTGSTIDLEARRRGNSVYLPDRVIPMLPFSISNDVCSLRPNEDRLVVVCEMMFSSDGVCERFEFFEAVIRSAARLTYTEVASSIGSKLRAQSADAHRSIAHLHGLYQTLTARRQDRGALQFTPRESTVRVRNGEPTGVQIHNQNDAHGIFEEAMIAANCCAAAFLEDKELSTMFRVHARPDSTDIAELRSNLEASGLKVSALDWQQHNIQGLLEQIRRETPTPWIWEIQVLRTMAQAVYSYENIGHFGLALERYSHFTSPIRRYSDLFVHRSIKACIRRGETQEEEDAQPELGEELSLCERRASEVTQRVEAWLKCALLQKQVGKLFVGHIVRIEKFGLFVELDSYYIAGLVHVSNLRDDFYEIEGAYMVGMYTGRVFKIGDSLKVCLASVDVEQARVDLVLDSDTGEKFQYRQGKLRFKRGQRQPV